MEKLCATIAHIHKRHTCKYKKHMHTQANVHTDMLTEMHKHRYKVVHAQRYSEIVCTCYRLVC